MSEGMDSSDAQLFREGLDHINQGISIIDKNLNIVAWNQQFLTVLGIPSELVFYGAKFSSFIRYNAEHGEYGDGDIEELITERVARAKRFESHQFERERPDGTIVQVIGSPLPGGGFVTVYTDVTDRRRREYDLKRRAREGAKAQELSEERLQLIANEVPAGIAHIDRDMRILFANTRFARAYGLTPEEIVGQHCNDVLHPKTVIESAGFFERARRGALVDFELKITMANNRIYDVRTFLRPERQSKGEVIGFYIMSMNVTNEKSATAALLRSQKMDALGRLSTGISHDFNNLLTVILGNLVPLADQIQNDKLREEYLEPTISAARRGSGLTKRLLNIARRQPINPAPVSAEKAIQDLVKLLQSSLPDSITLKTKLSNEKQCIFVDVSELETALLNIIVNARDAMGDRGEIVVSTDVVKLTATEALSYKISAGEYLSIVISDTGAGMSPSETERIFEPFYTTKAETGGSGMGLAMVYGFVQQSDGAILVESDVGKGTSFILLLPTTEEPEEVAVEPSKLESNNPALDHLLVLLVEDDKEVRHVVRRQLVDLGYSVIEAETADGAMELISILENVGLILSDVAMPGKMDGRDLANAIKTSRPELPIVLMSGHLDEYGRHQQLPETTPLLRKPFSSAELSTAFGLAIERAQKDESVGDR